MVVISPYLSLRYQTCYTTDYTVYLLPKNEPCLPLLPTPQSQNTTTYLLVLITPSHGGMARLS